MREAFAVLGMHRSGTSCVTGLLEQAGVFLGEVATKSPWNLKGNRENPTIMSLHDTLLAFNGGSWDAPPATVVWPEELQRARDVIIEGYRAAPRWGFKDPRTLLVLEGWQAALPGLRLVGVFRHPMLVAESLMRRNGFAVEKGLQLWIAYNRLLLAHHAHFRFPVLSFDEDSFTNSFARLACVLGLPAAPDRGNSFFDPALRHVTPTSDQPLPGEIQEVYIALQRLAL